MTDVIVIHNLANGNTNKVKKGGLQPRSRIHQANAKFDFSTKRERVSTNTLARSLWVYSVISPQCTEHPPVYCTDIMQGDNMDV